MWLCQVCFSPCRSIKQICVFSWHVMHTYVVALSLKSGTFRHDTQNQLSLKLTTQISQSMAVINGSHLSVNNQENGENFIWL